MDCWVMCCVLSVSQTAGSFEHVQVDASWVLIILVATRALHGYYVPQNPLSPFRTEKTEIIQDLIGKLRQCSRTLCLLASLAALASVWGVEVNLSNSRHVHVRVYQFKTIGIRDEIDTKGNNDGYCQPNGLPFSFQTTSFVLRSSSITREALFTWRRMCGYI